MDGIEVGVVSLRELAQNMAKAGGTDFEGAASDLVRQAGQMMLANAQRTVPRKTGALAGSLQLILMGPMTAVIGPTLPYGVFVQYGTRPHVIRAVRATHLAFMGRNGKMVYAKEVHHPGTRPNPFMTNALADTLDELTSHLGHLGVAKIVGGAISAS